VSPVTSSAHRDRRGGRGIRAGAAAPGNGSEHPGVSPETCTSIVVAIPPIRRDQTRDVFLLFVVLEVIAIAFL
jgi:hypothetical protein